MLAADGLSGKRWQVNFQPPVPMWYSKMYIQMSWWRQLSTDAAHKLSRMHHRCVSSTRDILHPEHYNNQYKRSSSVGLWWSLCCVQFGRFCSLKYIYIYIRTAVWSSFWRTQHEPELKAPFWLTERGPLSTGVCSLYHMPPRINSAILPRNSIHKQRSANGFCVQYICAVTHLACTPPPPPPLLRGWC